jgi:Heparinase II/III-like protein
VRNSRWTALLRAGGIGQYGKGGHAHNDQLQALFWIDGYPLVIDPGSSTYTGDPKQRNHERSIQNHATCIVDGQEQNLWPSDESEGLFWLMGDRFGAHVVERRSGFWHGRSAGTGQERSVEIGATSVTITDHAPASRKMCITIPLHPMVQVVQEDTTVRLSVHGRDLELCFPNDGVVVCEPCLVSPAFAVQQHTTKVTWTGQGTRIRWTIALTDA